MARKLKELSIPEKELVDVFAAHSDRMYKEKKRQRPKDTEEILRKCPNVACVGSVIRRVTWRAKFDPHRPIGPGQGSFESEMEVFCNTCKALYQE
jgi:hypothetical protein